MPNAQGAQSHKKAPEFGPAQGTLHRGMPPWLRPSLNLHWQFAFFYTLLLLVCVFILVITANVASTQPFNEIALALVILGAFAIFLLAGFLLRPLRNMTDTAQAIALGDLEQRERLPLGNDEVGKLAAILYELAEQVERAVEAQRASEQRARRFLSDASHQLRTPLTSLRGFTEVLMRGAKDDPQTMQRVLQLMKNEAERMTRLIQDLLVLARVDEAHSLQMRYVDLVELAIEEVNQTKELASDGRAVSLDLTTSERLGTQADPDHLRQVLHILLDNALKYGCPAGEGWIILRMEKQDDQVHMHVLNNGKGIAPEDLPHVFERFYRGKQITTHGMNGMPATGAGLGLSIAFAIIQAHQGNISAHSEPDKETRFTVSLPSCSPTIATL